MSQSRKFDVAIIVPKADELVGLEKAFGISFVQSAGTLKSGVCYYRTELPRRTSNLQIAVVFMNNQTGDPTVAVVQETYAELDPRVVFLTGTALGVEGRVELGQVIASSQVTDARQWVTGKTPSARTDSYHPKEAIKTDAARFFKKRDYEPEWKREVARQAQAIYDNPEVASNIANRATKEVHFKGIVSGNYYVGEPDPALKQIVDNDDRIYCYDMESAGLAYVCANFPERQWLVVRGVSDFGHADLNHDKNRVFAATNASLILKLFIQSGLNEALGPREITEQYQDSMKLLTTRYGFSHAGARVYIHALKEGAITADNIKDENPGMGEEDLRNLIGDLVRKRAIWEPIAGSGTFTPLSLDEMLSYNILSIMQGLMEDKDSLQRDLGQLNPVGFTGGRTLKVLEREQVVDRIVLTLIRNARSEEVRMCVRRISPASNTREFADTVQSNELKVKVLLVYHEKEARKEGLERATELAKILPRSMFQVKKLSGRENFRYMVIKDTIIFVTGDTARHNAVLIEDADIARWFKRVFDEDFDRGVRVKSSN